MKHRTLKGEMVDMSLFMTANPTAVAIGNAGMNAAGDKIGSGGKIIKTRAEIIADYNQTNPRSVRKVPLKDLEKELFQSPSEAFATVKTAMEKQQADVAAKNKRKLSDSK